MGVILVANKQTTVHMNFDTSVIQSGALVHSAILTIQSIYKTVQAFFL